MPHCQICDFCETTPYEGHNYYTDLGGFGTKNYVRFYPDLNQDLCRDCSERVSVIRDIYKDEQEEIMPIDDEITSTQLALPEV